MSPSEIDVARSYGSSTSRDPSPPSAVLPSGIHAPPSGAPAVPSLTHWPANCPPSTQ